MKKVLRRQGFTIIEVIITIIVIGVLSSISVLAYQKTQALARDNKRKSDIITLSNALERYYDKNGQYPAGCTLNGSCEGSTGLVTYPNDNINPSTTAAQLSTILDTDLSKIKDPRSASSNPFTEHKYPVRNYGYSYHGGAVLAPSSNTVSGLANNYWFDDMCTYNFRLDRSGYDTDVQTYILLYRSETENVTYVKAGEHGNLPTLPSGSTNSTCKLYR